MGFGIKTKIIKTIEKLKRPVYLYKDLITDSFPKHPYSEFKINSRLNVSLDEVMSLDIDHNIGLLSPKVDKYAVKIYQRFVRSNANNIGNWSITPPNHGTRQLEYEVVQKLINLYKGKKEDLEGYVTSGGSEGNLFSVWVGKAFVTQKHSIDKVCLLKTSLTHYSIDKACIMYSLKYFDIPVKKDTWTMDPKSLELEMRKQIKNGILGFVISLTFGFTETGTSDDLVAVTTLVNKLKKEYKKISVSILIDGAFNGLIEPFVTKDYKTFLTKDVHVFSVDFSKFTAVPYPAGVSLYRKHLRKMIERDVQFFPVPDNTLLGSRPGSAVAAIWGTIHKYGISGYRKVILRQIEVKKYFIKRILEIFPDVQIITAPNGLTCGVILSKKQFKMLPPELEYHYRVYAKEESVTFSDGETKKLIICKFFFLSHMTKKAVDDILIVVKKSVEKHQDIES